MVTIGDSHAPPSAAADPSSPVPRSVQGDLLALLSAMLYATYTLTIKLMLPQDGKVQ